MDLSYSDYFDAIINVLPGQYVSILVTYPWNISI